MSGLYTNYETSLRLKEAGAPQTLGRPLALCECCGPVIRIDEDGCCATCGLDATAPDVRFFRADEIAEALGVRLDYIRRSDNGGDWIVHVVKERCRITVDEYDGATLVEALAAAWIAALEMK